MGQRILIENNRRKTPAYFQRQTHIRNPKNPEKPGIDIFQALKVNNC